MCVISRWLSGYLLSWRLFPGDYYALSMNIYICSFYIAIIKIQKVLLLTCYVLLQTFRMFVNRLSREDRNICQYPIFCIQVTITYIINRVDLLSLNHMQFFIKVTEFNSTRKTQSLANCDKETKFQSKRRTRTVLWKKIKMLKS